MSSEERTQTNITIRISAILQELGAKHNRKGCKYLELAILKVYNDQESVHNFIEQFYIPTANEYGIKTYCTLINCISREIAIIWKQNQTSALTKYFGKILPQLEKAPHNMEFISIIAMYLHLQEQPSELKARIYKLLIDLGIFPHTKGFWRLSEAIEMTYEDLEIIYNSKKGIIGELAKKYTTTEFAIERCIRVAIERAWNKGNIKYMEEYFGNICSNCTFMPTNRQFIATIADQLHLQDNPKNSIMIRISKILRELGISAQVRGYTFLRIAIELVYRDSTKANKFTSTISKTYGIELKKLKREMAISVGIIWKHKEEEILKRYFNEREYHRKPSNTEFVCAIAEYLKAEDHKNN